MQRDSVSAHPIFTSAGEALTFGLYLATAGIVALALVWFWRRSRRRR